MDRLTEIREKLLALADPEYAAFASRIVPTVPPERIVGVKIPRLRQFAKEEFDPASADAFLDSLPHRYYEEDLLHGILIARMKEPAAILDRLDEFLPRVDNWAVCDTTSPKALKKDLPALLERINAWLGSGRTYTVRYAVVSLMNFFLDDAFDPACNATVAAIQSDEYYVKMAAAWYFATAIAKQPEATLPYFERGLPDPWTHNKAIQKAIESYRVDDKMKSRLRELKIKTKG